MYNTQYYALRQNFMDEYNKILSKMHKDLVLQIVHQKMQQKMYQKFAIKKCTITMFPFIKQFMFTNLVECFC